MILFNGISQPISKWAKQLGYSDEGQSLRYRIKIHGLEKAMAMRPKQHTVTYNGISKTIKQWAVELNVTHHILRQRILDGGIEKALGESARPNTFYTIGSETHTAHRWATLRNLNDDTVYKRLQSGKTIEEALEPTDNRRT